MEKLVIVAGSPNTGKTTTTNLVIGKLIDKGYNVCEYFDNKQTRFWTELDENGEPNQNSGRVVLEKEGKKIYVITYGDSVKGSLDKIFPDLFSNLDKYYAVVCCSHATRGRDVFKYVKGYVEKVDLNTTQVVPLHKNFLCNWDNRRLGNESFANFIVDILK